MGTRIEQGAPAARHEPCSSLEGAVSSLRSLDIEGSGVITNHLDEIQEQQLDAVYRALLMRAYPRSVSDPRVKHGFCSADPAIEGNTRALDRWAST
ncbi:hypothetical protein Plhal710r2_c003g0014971 [Plasmopara halstedii]